MPMMDASTKNKEDAENAVPVVNGEINTDNATSLSRVLVAESETVRPVVLWERRVYTDKLWAVLYILAYIAFLCTGFVLVAKSRPRYERDPDTDVKVVSSYFQESVAECCQEIADRGEESLPYDLCDQLEASEERRRRAEESKFDGDEGIFDAFLEAPEIIVGLLSLTVVLAIGWVVLLRFCSKPVVFVTELLKVFVFIYMGVSAVRSEVTETGVICFLIAAGILAYDYWARKEILFAAEIISHAAKAFKENPWMFVGLIFVKLFYVLNAYLFVLFFSEAFEVVEVEMQTSCYNDVCYSACRFEYPGYVSKIATYLCLAYLWSVILFAKMRLSVVANIVGSWHFHPENKPGIVKAVTNTLTTSFGTLCVSSLISTIAERINRILQEPWWRSWIGPAAFVTLPLQLFLCIFGSCIGAIIKMLTSFAVILHVFTGLPFIGAARKVYSILSRHFKGGFVTEATSRGVLYFGAYFFSLGIALLSWVWFDKAFNCDTFPGGRNAAYAIGWIIFGLFNLWYPVLGIYIIILINRVLQSNGNGNSAYDDDDSEQNEVTQHLWVSPLAAIFVGCIAMMFFTYLAGIFLDTVDVLFLCFAVEKDNNVDMSDDEFNKLIESMPAYVKGDEYKEYKEGESVVAVPIGTATHIPVDPPQERQNVNEMSAIA